MSKHFKDLTGKEPLVQIEFNNPVSKKKPKKGSGCSSCIQNDNPNVRKIKGFKRIKQRKIFLWCQNPGKRENEEGKELVGPAGKWLWDELKRVGIDRSDCDIQNVVRCQFLKEDEETGDLIDSTPPQEVIKCCSVYNQEAINLNGGKAKVHLVFGQIAAKSLLGKEFKKDTPIFWSQRLKAKVVCLDHPAYFLRGAPKHRLEQFRERLTLAIGSIKHIGKYGYLKQQDYATLTSVKDIRLYLKYISNYARSKKKAIVVDIETGWLYKDWDSEKLRSNEVWAETPGVRPAMLMVGLNHAPGRSRAIVYDHPDYPSSLKTKKRIQLLLKRFLEDKSIEKVFHYGSSDTDALKEQWGVKVKNYWFDTNYSTYLKWPQLKKYGLDNLSKEKVPEFAGYKDIVKEYLVKDKANFATIPLKVLGQYNCADTDITKRLEIITRKDLISRDWMAKPLLKTYKDVAYTLRGMQMRGPFFDIKYAKRFSRRLIVKLRYELKKLRELSGLKELNPRSHPQVKKVVYEVLGLPIITVKRKEGRTDEGTLEALFRQTKHPFIKHLLAYRGYSVMKRTQLKGYSESAKCNNGRLKTTYWLTGTITGRLRSGGKKDEAGIVNLQNIPKAPAIKNMLISDPMWRMLEEWITTKQYKTILSRKVYLVADYSAIELRVIAEMAEPKFVTIFNSDKDIHGMMGSNFTDWTYEQICTDEEIRTKVKNIDFGVPYGTGKAHLHEGLLARGTKITRRDSDKLHDNYFAEYTGVRQLQIDSSQEVEETGHVKTMFGFYRPVLTGDYADEETRGSYWKNQAINSKVQGTAHQYLLFALALLHTKKKTYNQLQESSMEIHDALAFLNQVRYMQQAYKQLKHLLEVAVPEYVKKYFKYKLKVPLVCEVKAGFRLGTMVKYKGEDPIEFVKNWLKESKKVNKKVKEEWGVAA